jgi:carboxyl-terminal processing protease
VTLTRQKVTYPAVTSKLLGDGVGLITVSSLETDQVAQTGASVRELEKQGAKRLILDLRNCASGSPESGIKLASLFLSSGLVTYTQGQKSPRQNFDAAGQPVDAKTPLVVLTNRGTADGAEIAAAALQDDKRAQVVGERTYGDASIRKAITMDDGAAVILSVAKYYSPAGKAIQDTGVVPAVMVAEGDAAPIEPDDDSVPSTLQTPKPSEDLPLKKAIELLTKGGEVASSQPSTQAQSQLTRPQ